MRVWVCPIIDACCHQEDDVKKMCRKNEFLMVLSCALIAATEA